MNLTVVGVYILFVALFIFVLLFGQPPNFEGTIVQKGHYFITEGICTFGSSVVVKFCGKRGQRVLDLFGEYYCDRPNPTLQLFYLSLVTGGYLIFINYSFDRLPGPYLSDIHCYTGPLAVLVSLGTFLLTSLSDPGTITAENVDRHIAAYPFDNTLYCPKMCRTMRIPAPARSKFDNITNRRVARFDHFCSWMNNAIGENNYRYFLSFLFLHIFLFVYATAFFVALLAGEVARRGVLEVPFPGDDGEPVWLKTKKTILFQWILYHFPAEAMLAAFVGFTTLLVSGFLGYHLTLVNRGMTTYESLKWKDLRHELLERAAEDGARAREEEAAGEEARGRARGRGRAEAVGHSHGERGAGAGAGAGVGGDDAPVRRGGFLGILSRAVAKFRRRREARRRRKGADLMSLVSPEDLEEINRICCNPYHRGFWGNLGEIFWPRSGRPEVIKAADAAKAARTASLAAAAGGRASVGKAAGAAGAHGGEEAEAVGGDRAAPSGKGRRRTSAAPAAATAAKDEKK